MTWVLYETKMFISIYHLSMVHHVELFLKCIERHWFMASRVKKKIHDFQKLKTFKRWFHQNFHRAKKKGTDGFPSSLGTETKDCFP